MGAEQSSTRNSQQDSNPPKTCYYELLDIGRQATDEDIKKAYRKKALELHPDRNYGNVESATIRFAEVQSAYQVLSDPQERAWYDAHRDSILQGEGGPAANDQFEHDAHLTSARDIVGLMSRFNSRTPFTDGPDGFFGILQDTFERLAREEDAASSWDGLEALDYPGFGRSTDDYEDVVRPFYQVWNGFSTKKTFSWRDEYRSSDAPNRATRRLVEQENKKLRDEGIREFNEAVRTLVAFVRKRDPRYVPNTQTETERQKAIRDASAAQAARSRAANQAKLAQHIVPDWARSEKTQDDESFSDSSESVVQEIECVVCQKTFKSEKQYEAHEKSKKHAKAVQSLQREMKRDDQRFNLNEIPVSRVGVAKEDSENLVLNTEISNPESADKDLGESTVENRQAWETETSMAAEAKADTSLGIENDFLGSDTESELDDDYVQLRTVPSGSGHTSAVLAADATTEKGELSKGPKLGKAKAKRVKKAARQELEDQATGGFQCITCKNDFPSKNKLFAHINALGHAPLASVTSSGKKKRR